MAKLAETGVREVTMRRLKGQLLPPAGSHVSGARAVPNLQTTEDAIGGFRGGDSVFVPFEDSESNDILLKLSATSTPPQLVTKSWRVLLDSCSADDKMRKALKLARARFALGLSFWIILLWETAWFNKLCACAFRCALFPLLNDPDSDGEGIEGQSTCTARSTSTLAALT